MSTKYDLALIFRHRGGSYASDLLKDLFWRSFFFTSSNTGSISNSVERSYRIAMTRLSWTALMIHGRIARGSSSRLWWSSSVGGFIGIGRIVVIWRRPSLRSLQNITSSRKCFIQPTFIRMLGIKCVLSEERLFAPSRLGPYLRLRIWGSLKGGSIGPVLKWLLYQLVSWMGRLSQEKGRLRRSSIDWITFNWD